jgi:hypothetical protein
MNIFLFIYLQSIARMIATIPYSTPSFQNIPVSMPHGGSPFLVISQREITHEPTYRQFVIGM